MSDHLTHTERWRNHQQPRRVDYTRPGFVRPPDPKPSRLPSCYECKRELSEGESAWAYDWTVITPDGPHAETRYSCDDCGNGGGPDAA